MDEYTVPDWGRCALLTVDVQNDFSLAGAVCEVEGTMRVVPEIARLLAKFREKKKTIVHVVRLYKRDGTNADACRKRRIEAGLRVAEPGSEGAEIVAQLKPNEKRLDAEKLLAGQLQEIASNEFVVYKPRWGAFYNTPLEKFLKSKEINTLVFTGCNFPNCPRTTIYEASERDFRTILVEDAVSGVYEKAIQELKNIECTVIKSNELLKRLEECP